ncbi:hypothetical protein [Calycomorphotria hydatis]|uniref:Uncharacterized protein n=1 Tax=Calycomorphotria hydatis TaxID=2528027 RepID=A0A517T4T4_9PLAN|nr:hypothetical protein [Calycomorphotria hydatis]QDT63393.1 hypothetical protein V22_06140 [Calycomorphotria hydatis]
MFQKFIVAGAMATGAAFFGMGDQAEAGHGHGPRPYIAPPVVNYGPSYGCSPRRNFYGGGGYYGNPYGGYYGAPRRGFNGYGYGYNPYGYGRGGSGLYIRSGNFALGIRR